MKHARPDYDGIPDIGAARELASLALEMSMATERGQLARDLARQVLGIENPNGGVTAITTNGTTRVIPMDEPVFLIRGQDAVGADAVRAWADLAERAGAASDIVEIARDHAAKMDAWPKKKVPDLP